MAVYLLALAAALLFAVGSVVQQHVAFEAPPGKSLKLSLLWWLVRQPVWLVGVATALVGNGFSSAALGVGSVALVQPLLVSRLLFALPLSAAWARQRLSGRDWLGVLATAGGLAAFIAIGRPQPAEDSSAPLWRWAVTAAAIGLVSATLVLLARRLNPAREAPMLGASAGMLFGLQSGLTEVAVHSFLDDGLTGLLTNWTSYAVPVTAVVGTLLAQSAYEMAPLAASYPALAAIEPLAGIGIGVGVLGGALAFGVLPLGLQIVALAVMTAGIFLLATSPLVTGKRKEMQRKEAEGRAYRTEDEIEHDLRGVEKSLQRIESRPRRDDGDMATLGQRLDRAEQQLTQLSDLEATAREGDTAGPPATDHQRALREWEEEIEDRQRQLRAKERALRERVRALK